MRGKKKFHFPNIQKIFWLFQLLFSIFITLAKPVCWMWYGCPYRDREFFNLYYNFCKQIYLAKLLFWYTCNISSILAPFSSNFQQKELYSNSSFILLSIIWVGMKCFTRKSAFFNPNISATEWVIDHTASVKRKTHFIQNWNSSA